MLGIGSLTLDNISLASGQLTAPGLYLVIEKGYHQNLLINVDVVVVMSFADSEGLHVFVTIFSLILPVSDKKCDLQGATLPRLHGSRGASHGLSGSVQRGVGQIFEIR